MLKQLAATGATPKALERKPELTEWIVPYIVAFNALSSSRQTGMAVGYIPITEIKAYAEMIEEDHVLEFMQIIQQADSVFIATINKRKNSKVTAKKGK